MDRIEAYALLKMPFADLVSLADRTRRDHALKRMELCSIMNAKSGLCGEDCKFCAQSKRHSTGISSYPLKGGDEMIEGAKRARDIGAGRFDIVTSGNALSKDEVLKIADTIAKIRSSIGIEMCASLGRLDEKSLVELKKAGLGRYHHNIETSPRHYPKIVSTHSFGERLEMIGAIKRSGLEACSGGIIGLGETWEDRVEMALVLKSLDVTSVPINMLVPIKGTPLESAPPISAIDAIRTIAIFRIILKDKVIKVAAGRESVLRDFQAMAFMAGANGMLIGGYLTIKGRSVEDDKNLVVEIEKAWKR